MRDCERILPVISRLAEGEASPQEALDGARHLPVCTACRILLARERRLAMLIEADLPDLPVGEGFVAAVMAKLNVERVEYHETNGSCLGVLLHEPFWD